MQKVVADLSNHDLKRTYAQWLAERNDPRGPLLQSVLDDWEAGKEVLAADEGADAVWRNTSGVTLLQQLREGKLDSHAASICLAARAALTIKVIPTEHQLPVGATKFGGKPDLSENALWPEYEGKLHTFIGQFRLERFAADASRGDPCPRTGLLSFFVFDDPIETGQPAAEGDEGAWKVIYTADTLELRRLDPPKSFDEGNRLAPECNIQMEETLDLPNVKHVRSRQRVWR